MRYGIRFVYIGGQQNTETFYETEADRNRMFCDISNCNWRGTVICDRTIINLANVIYAEQFERRN